MMDFKIKWVHTPTCKECSHYNKLHKKCKEKQCVYANKRWTGNTLKHGGNYG